MKGTTSLEQRKGQWLKGVLDLCVLGALLEGEAYGYQLSRMLGEAGMGVVKGGTLYPVLSRLEGDGLVSVSRRPSGQGPDRKYYTISSEGRTLLGRAAKEWRLFTETTMGLMDPAGEDRLS